LVAKGKKMGLEISTAYVYTLRSSDRAKAGKAPVKTSSGGGVDVGNGRAPKASRDLEGILIDAVVDLGGKTVQELLQAAISRVKATAKNK
jgi:precorrin-6B methylase 2